MGALRNQARRKCKVISLIRNLLRPIRQSATKGSIKRIFHWFTSAHIRKYFIIKFFLKKNEKRYLQVGGGKHRIKADGWINGDIIDGEIYLNACKPLPFPNNSLDGIFSEQFIEHIGNEEASYFLSECFRVLKGGGLIRTGTPCLRGLLEIYEDQNSHVTFDKAAKRLINSHLGGGRKKITPAEFINYNFRLWGHQFIYDYHTLELKLKNSGFENTSRCSFGESENTTFEGLERHSDIKWMESAYQLIIEACKPKDR